MLNLTKIAVDAMGGDGSPKKIIDGIIHNHKSNTQNFFIIFGNKKEIEPFITDKISKEFFEQTLRRIFKKKLKGGKNQYEILDIMKKNMQSNKNIKPKIEIKKLIVK